MVKKIYGVDPDKSFSAIDVREAIVKCFVNAHEYELDKLKEFAEDISGEDFDKIKTLDVEGLTKKFFDEVGGDYKQPTKESIIQVCEKLAEFAGHFRNNKEIKKHYDEIMELVNKLV